MSYLHMICPWCGTGFTTGIIGSTVVGTGHICTVREVCSHEGCEENGNVLVTDAEDLFAERSQFVCVEHIGDLTVLQFQMKGTP